MASTTPNGDEPKKWRAILIDSQLLGWIVNLPLISWIIREISRRLMKSSPGNIPEQGAEAEVILGTGLNATLQRIAQDVVRELGYVGAMVAPYEQGDSLPVRAFYIDPRIATEEQIKEWEAKISEVKGERVSLTDPDIARSFRYKDEFKDNLSIRAVKAGEPVTSNDLYDLFRPVAPPASKPFVESIQKMFGIHQVIAVPFFLEVRVDGQNKREIVGNLFAAKRDIITENDKHILSAFGRQAAAAIQLEQRRKQILVTYNLVYTIQTSLNDETQILKHIARGVVEQLDYVGAMVAPYEQGDSLPVRAFYIDPGIATEEQIKEWEAKISEVKGERVSLTDPDIARSFRYKDEFKDNLSIRAVEAGKPVTSNDLYDLFRPVAPPASKPFVESIQKMFGIHQVIAAPFFLEVSVDGQIKKEVKGNLFAASRSRSFTAGEIELLRAFGQQAAIGIRNAQLYRTVEELYRKSEERREQAQVFSRMAFGATASLHELRNHIGTFRMFSSMALKPEKLDGAYQEIYKGVTEKLNRASDILDNLHEPWQLEPDKEVDINQCLKRAVSKLTAVSILEEHPVEIQKGVFLNTRLSNNLPSIKTSPEMLTEAFRVLIKNAIEAVSDKSQNISHDGNIWIESQLDNKHDTIVNVSIRDDGVGIKAEDLDKVFEMKWSTKQVGMGFGLFWTKDYVEGLEGSIEVTSVWQKGTCFVVQLPIKVSQKNV